MSFSLDNSGFIAKADVAYRSSISGKTVIVKSSDIVSVIVNANQYLASLNPMFKEIGFDIYSSLGQRNLSGFVGEVFSKSFDKLVSDFHSNPHADGRPDLLDLTSAESKEYFRTQCCVPQGDTSIITRSLLAPYKFGGIEVKTSIGSPQSGCEASLKEKFGVSEFLVGIPRIEFISSITFWGHHTSCKNLLGLYYDYVPEVASSPQILAAMHAELDPNVDWHKVSIGKSESKKTSNTSLTVTGRQKLYANVIAVTNNKIYLENLQKLGLNVP